MSISYSTMFNENRLSNAMNPAIPNASPVFVIVKSSRSAAPSSLD